MKNLTLATLLMLTTACLSDLVEVEEAVNPDNVYCIYNTDYSAPAGWSLICTTSSETSRATCTPCWPD